MIIIVEGIDRVGKTTLCNKIKDEFEIPIYKHIGNFDYSKMDNDNETDKMLQLIQLSLITKSTIIFDRFHFTDYVYGNIERNYDVNKSSKNFIVLDNFLSTLDDVFLFLIEPTNLEESSRQHGKDLSMHKKMFDDIYKESKIKNKCKCTYNTLDEAILFINSKER